MPINSQTKFDIPSYKPSKKDKRLVLDIMNRIKDLQEFRSKLRANPYDDEGSSRSIEETWDYADYVSLPHKYSHPEMREWMANNSNPLIMAKMDTAVSLLVAQNPQADITPRNDKKFEFKAKMLEALYHSSWDKGNGRQQLVKFINQLCKDGFVIAKEYHRFKTRTIEEITGYDPKENKHFIEKKEIIEHDEPFMEVLPIRDCWFDNRAKPYDESSMRDWAYQKVYDYSTFLIEFPKERYPNAIYCQPSFSESGQTTKDKADVSDIDTPAVRLYFYEDMEDDKVYITDGLVLVYEGPLINHELSCVTAMWKYRNDHTIYGIGVPEMLENNQELTDRIMNMSVNQVILAISGAGFYGGTGNLNKNDAILEPKLKKLKDAEKIQFPKVPDISGSVFKMLEVIKDDADEVSGITKSLGGEQVGKTLGEAVLNREAGLRRMATPLNNIEFALERQAKLRVNLIQLIYSRPERTEVVVDEFENVINDDLFKEYIEERGKLGAGSNEFVQKFPVDDTTGEIFRNQYRKERLPLEKTAEGEVEATESDNILEITPEEIRGEYDVRIRAFSTLPASQTLEESRALETFNIIAKLPYTDVYRAQKMLLKKRKENPDDWMISEDQIIATQQEANNPPPMPEGMEDATGGFVGKGAFDDKPLPLEAPQNLEQPAARGGITGQVTQATKI